MLLVTAQADTEAICSAEQNGCGTELARPPLQVSVKSPYSFSSSILASNEGEWRAKLDGCFLVIGRPKAADTWSVTEILLLLLLCYTSVHPIVLKT